MPDPSAALQESPIARSLRGAETRAKLVLAAERYKREERRCIAMMILKRGNLEMISRKSLYFEAGLEQLLFQRKNTFEEQTECCNPVYICSHRLDLRHPELERQLRLSRLWGPLGASGGHQVVCQVTPRLVQSLLEPAV